MNGTPAASEDLQAFVATATDGSLTGAAAALGLPKSTISRRLARLEAHLNVRLFVRHRQRLRLSDDGAALLSEARAMLDGLVDLGARLRGRSAEPRGRLRVSVPRDLAAFPDVWLDFAQEHPQVALEIELTNRYVDVVREGFDVALRGGRGDDETLTARRVGGYALVAVATPAYLAEHGTLDGPADLRRHSCILLSPLRKRAGHPDRPEPPHRHLIYNDPEFARRAALRGLGVAILAPHLVAEDRAAGRLVSALAAYDPLRVPLYAVYPDRAYLRGAVTRFLAFVATRFDEQRGED